MGKRNRETERPKQPDRRDRDQKGQRESHPRIKGIKLERKADERGRRRRRKKD